MKQINFIIFFIVVLSLSCSREKWEYSETLYNIDEQLELHVDSVVIQLDSLSLPEYLSKTAILENNDSLRVYAYNHKTNNLDIFYLEEKKIDHIPLNREGENAVLDVLSLQVITEDSIFIYDGVKYLLLNKKGEVFWKRKAIFNNGNKIYTLESSFFTKLFYDYNNNRIYGRYMSTGDGYPFPEKNIFSYYDISKDSLVVLPLEVPSYIDKNKFSLGRNVTLHAFFYKDRICFNFSGISDVFVYNIYTNELFQKGGKSLLLKEHITSYDGDFNDSSKKWKHFLQNTNYNPFLYNSNIHLYYRISFGDFIGEEDFGNLGHFKKRIVLTVFNEKLDIIKEYNLPNFKFNFLDYFPVKEGFITFGNNPLNNTISYENIVFYKISIR